MPNFILFTRLLALTLLLSSCASRDPTSNPPLELPLVLQKIADVETLDEPAHISLQRREQELTELHQVKPGTYEISAGDKFNVFVYGEPDLDSKQAIVKLDGSLTFKLIGDVQIAGKTVPQATALIEKELQRYIHFPKVTLMPYDMRSASITIIGKVIHPGVYYFDGSLRAAEAIGLAGGFSTGVFDDNTIELADLEHSYIQRGEYLLPVDLTKLIRKGNMHHNVPLVDGDYVYIASSMSQEVFITGEVNKPSYYGYSERMTLARLVSRAEGLLLTANSHVLAIRGNIKHPLVYKVNIDKILNGETRDFLIQPNDLVYVPKSMIGSWNALLSQLMPTLETMLTGLLLEHRVSDLQSRN